MALSQTFQDELDAVDNSRSFTEILDGTYGQNEWSVAGWTLTAGSAASLEHAASEAMHSMGYRWFTPYQTHRPATLPAGGVSLSRQEFQVPYLKVFLNYSFGSDPVLTADYERWTTLNCANDQRRPNGHTWKTIINANQAYYDANPTHYRSHGVSGGGRSFELDDPTIRAANLAICVDYLSTRLNEEDRASFDPDDGDSYPSDVVFAFANDVVAELRANHNPNAKLGLYAYAGHRAPASFQCPHLYVQVALGFNDLGIGYPALVDQWRNVCPEVTLRGYGDIAAQNGFLPFYNGINRTNFFGEAWDSYIASGADGLNMETTANWALNIVSHWQMIRWCRDPSYTRAQARNEVVAHVFGGDPAADALFVLLGDENRATNVFSMYEVGEAIDALQDGPPKLAIQQYFVICEKHLRMTGGARAPSGEFNTKADEVTDAVYFSRLEANLRRVAALEYQGHIHSYAYERQLSNFNVSGNGRHDLAFSETPHWLRFPEAPTAAEFDTILADFVRLAARPAQLADLDDLVVVDVEPKGEIAASPQSATDYYTQGGANFILWNDTGGDVTVSHTYEQTYRGVKTETFGPGLHETKAEYNATTTWTGGTLFLNAFPNVRLDPSLTGGERWCYIPKIVKGRLDLTSRVRLTLRTETGRFDIFRVPIQELPSGVAKIDNTNTRGDHNFNNVCPFISPRPDKMLMPRALAEAEFPARTVIQR